MTACCLFADRDTGECFTKQFMFLDTRLADLTAGFLNIVLFKKLFFSSHMTIFRVAIQLMIQTALPPSHCVSKLSINTVSNDLVGFLCTHGARESTAQLKWSCVS